MEKFNFGFLIELHVTLHFYMLTHVDYNLCLDKTRLGKIVSDCLKFNYIFSRHSIILGIPAVYCNVLVLSVVPSHHHNSRIT